MLPEVRDSASPFGVTAGVPGIADGTPIAAAIGDSHAALFGHGAYDVGDGKVTFGTGSSIMATLPRFIAPSDGITTTVAWRIAGKPTFASKAISSSAPPACPGWPAFSVCRMSRRCWSWRQPPRPAARLRARLRRPWRALLELRRPRALLPDRLQHHPRPDGPAVADSIPFQVHDVFAAMLKHGDVAIGSLYVDGGPSRSDFLMQNVADILDHAVIQCEAPEASALGAAYLAGLTLGLWPDLAAIKALPRATRRIAPQQGSIRAQLKTWKDAIARSTFIPESAKVE